MDSYIKKEAFLEHMKKTSRYFAVKFDIEEFPTEDVAPVVYGEWEEYPDWSHLRCTNCKIEFERIKMPSTRHYCPNCGAKMDGERRTNG